MSNRWRVGQLVRRPVEHDRALRQADDAVGEAAGELHIVHVDDHWDAALAGAPRDQLHDLDRGLGIERGGRLVGENEVRLLHQRARDADALALPAGKLVGALGGEFAEADGIKQLEGALDVGRAETCAARRAIPTRNRAVRTARSRSPRAARPGCTPGRSSRCGGARRAAQARRAAPYPRPRNRISPAVGSTSRLMQRTERRLAGARRPDDGGQAARRDLERDIAQHRLALAILLGQVLMISDGSPLRAAGVALAGAGTVMARRRATSWRALAASWRALRPRAWPRRHRPPC